MAKKVLLVEDDEGLSDLYKRSLIGAGYEYDHATDGTTGQHYAQQYSYDLVLLDIMIPGRSGLTVLREIKEMQIQQNAKIFMISNLSDDLIKNQAKHLGADGFLVKFEFKPNELADEVKKIIGEA